jgi:predicted nucleic acid-binding protein
MAELVLDSSVAASWLLPDEASSRSQVLLNRVTAGSAIVPSNWPLEIAQALVSAERRGRIDRDERRRSLAILGRLPIVVEPIAPSLIWTDVVALAERHALTVYDAAYLELATRLDLPLATFDGALDRAARSAGVPAPPTV